MWMMNCYESWFEGIDVFDACVISSASNDTTMSLTEISASGGIWVCFGTRDWLYCELWPVWWLEWVISLPHRTLLFATDGFGSLGTFTSRYHHWGSEWTSCRDFWNPLAQYGACRRMLWMMMVMIMRKHDINTKYMSAVDKCLLAVVSVVIHTDRALFVGDSSRVQCFHKMWTKRCFRWSSVTQLWLQDPWRRTLCMVQTLNVAC